jgi:hypothetical protein
MATQFTVIFLDIDGVLLPFGGDRTKKEESCSGLFPDRTLAILNAILKHTDAVVVLSSTWRVRAEFRQQILQAFAYYNETFDGSLPKDFHDVTDIENHSERQWEIRDWLMTNHHTVKAWVALDDEELLEEEKNEKYRSEFEGHVVMTTSSVGLTGKDAETTIRLLKKQHQH